VPRTFAFAAVRYLDTDYDSLPALVHAPWNSSMHAPMAMVAAVRRCTTPALWFHDSPHPIPRDEQGRGIGDEIEPAVRITARPTVQLDLDLQYPAVSPQDGGYPASAGRCDDPAGEGLSH
jgi:hypothetical protein